MTTQFQIAKLAIGQMAFIPGRPPLAWMVGDDRYIVAAVVVLAIVPAP